MQHVFIGFYQCVEPVKNSSCHPVIWKQLGAKDHEICQTNRAEDRDGGGHPIATAEISGEYQGAELVRAKGSFA